MKWTRINPSDRVTKSKYPCLKVHKNGHFACLFTSDTVGTVVWADDTEPWGVGHHADNWLAVTFKPFLGVIELSND